MSVKPNDVCDVCDGIGLDDETKEDCNYCKGSGRAPRLEFLLTPEVIVDFLTTEEEELLSIGTHYLDLLGNVRPKLNKS
jgi:RecJ-like exonuclease